MPATGHPSSEEMNAKAQVRQIMRQKLANLTPEFKENASQEICRDLAEHIVTSSAKKIAIFAAAVHEPNLSELHHLLPAHEIHYPLCGVDRKMTFHHVPSPDELVAGKHSIAWPDPRIHPLVKPEDLDFILCPGLAFTKRGQRLGQGGGYYDRYLPLASQATVVGVAFSTQIIQEIPFSAHDFLMSGLITERGSKSRSVL